MGITGQVYKPKDGELMKVAFMFSGGATGLRTAVLGNKHYGKLYEVDFCLTDKFDCSGAQFASDVGIPIKGLPLSDFRDYSDTNERRKAYFTRINDIMQDVKPDVIVTSGFMLLAVDPFVKNWHGKIMNGHPANTSILYNNKIGDTFDIRDNSTEEVVTDFHGKGYKRKFIGNDAVHDAVLAGEKEVRTSVFFLDHGEDTGANITLSPPLHVDTKYVKKLIEKSNFDKVEAYASGLQDILKYEGDRPAINMALELAATGRLGISDDVLNPEGLPYLVTSSNVILPYCGLQID